MIEAKTSDPQLTVTPSPAEYPFQKRDFTVIETTEVQRVTIKKTEVVQARTRNGAKAAYRELVRQKKADNAQFRRPVQGQNR